CADGIPPDDPHFKERQEQQTLGQDLLAQGITLESLMPGESLDGLLEYTWLNQTNDALTSSGETLYRVQGATDTVLGTTGIAAGIGIGAVGAAGCAETLGATCLLLPVGATFVSLGFEQGEQGLNQLFGTYAYTEGQAVADSFYLSTYPGEINPARDLAIDW